MLPKLGQAGKMLLIGLLLRFVFPSGIEAANTTLNFRYDSSGRLSTVNHNAVTDTHFDYDANGNVLARIIQNEFIPALTGNYQGEITNLTPSFGSIGTIALRILRNGNFTGNLIVGSQRVRFRGTFAPDGTTAPIVVRGITLNLTLDTADPYGLVTGTVGDGIFLSEVALKRAGFHPRREPLPAGLVGRYTAYLSGFGAPSVVPEGDGYLLVSVAPNARLRAQGHLADGTRFTQATTLSGPDGDWFLYSSLYRRQGVVAGMIDFQTEPDFSFGGLLQWIKPASTSPFFPAGFDHELNVTGSYYQPPARGQFALDLWNTSPNLELIAIGGNLIAPPLHISLTLDTRNRFFPDLGPAAARLKLNARTGMISGTFLDNGARRRLFGALAQRPNGAVGFFLGTSESGLIEIVPAPD